MSLSSGWFLAMVSERWPKIGVNSVSKMEFSSSCPGSSKPNSLSLKALGHDFLVMEERVEVFIAKSSISKLYRTCHTEVLTLYV